MPNNVALSPPLKNEGFKEIEKLMHASILTKLENEGKKENICF